MLLQGDCIQRLKDLPTGSVHCCVTSPPYWGLRDYGMNDQIGLERTPRQYIAKMVEVFGEVRRVLREDGTLWLNLGDTYSGSNKGRWGNGGGVVGSKPMQSKARTSGSISYQAFNDGLKPKDLIGIPWRVAFALQEDGWYLRSDIIWSKPNPMPESVTDRPTKSHEYLFLLSKSERYYYDHESIKEPVSTSTSARMSQDIENQRGSERANGGAKLNGAMKAVGGGSERNKRTVWNVPTANFTDAHFATMPLKLVEPCVIAGCPAGGTVLDPFNGAGTTGLVAIQNGREYIGIELNPEYIKITEQRLQTIQPLINF